MTVYYPIFSCERNASITTTPPPPVHTNGDIRLNPGPHIGRLEYYYRGEWGAVCDNGWGNIDAIVACRQLGYE